MTRDETLKILRDVGLVPVIRAKSAEVLVDVARAILAGGVAVAEVTLTVPGAIEGIRRLVQTFGQDLLVGVGTVTKPHEVEAAAEAGAEFVVSPVLVPEVVAATRQLGKVSIPGAYTPTEIFQAHQLGADIIKIFPASVGGPAYFKALLAPMPFLKLMPTGGVDLSSVGPFIKAGAVTLGCGAALVDGRAIETRNWALLTDLARKFRDEVRKARGG